MPEQNQVELTHNPDAVMWSEAFVQAVEFNPAIATDKAVMLAWFANAIMSGYDYAKNHPQGAPPSPPAALKDQRSPTFNSWS